MNDAAEIEKRVDKLKLMIVEDDTLQSIDLEASLESMGHKVVAVAQHVDGAIRKLDKVGGIVDLVLLDVSLAGSYANPVASELDRRGIRYMAVTGLRQRDLDALGFKCPVIEKPFSSKNLAERLVAFESARKAVQSGTSFSSAGRMAE